MDTFMTLEFFFHISSFKLSSHDHISCVVLDFFWVEASLHLHVVILRFDPSWKILSFLISNHKLNPRSSGLWLIYLMIKVVPTDFRTIYPCVPICFKSCVASSLTPLSPDLSIPTYSSLAQYHHLFFLSFFDSSRWSFRGLSLIWVRHDEDGLMMRK